MVEEYNDSKAIEVDAIIVVVGVYVADFNGCKAKVIGFYPTLILPLITTSGILKAEEEEDEEVAEKGEAVDH